MRDKQLRQATREFIRVGHVRYEVAAVPVGEYDFKGEWECAICCRGDRSTVTHRHHSAAMGWARDCVSVHHAAYHASKGVAESC